MSEETSIVSVDELLETALAVIDVNPDRVNPKDSRTLTSLYTSKEDPDSHCLVAQIASDLDWNVPDSTVRFGAERVSWTFAWPVDSAGRSFLSMIQLEADGIASPRKWGSIRERIVRHHECVKKLIEKGHCR